MSNCIAVASFAFTNICCWNVPWFSKKYLCAYRALYAYSQYSWLNAPVSFVKNAYVPFFGWASTRCFCFVCKMQGEIFDLSEMSLPNISKFFWEQAKEEKEAAEVLIQYQHDRGGQYCTKVIQVWGKYWLAKHFVLSETSLSTAYEYLIL